jgi:hypothetical protein
MHYETTDRVEDVGLPCLSGADPNEELVRQIAADLERSGSVLALMKGYIEALAGTANIDAAPFRKLRRLFELGATPAALDGHHYGVTLGLRSGDVPGDVAGIGNLLGLLWGGTLGPVCPWVGKSFRPMSEGEAERLIGPAPSAGLRLSRGINHFHTIEHAPLNVGATALLTLLWQLREVEEAEEMRYGHQRNGGHFVAHRAPSVYAGTPREVLRLNYRHRDLGNGFPLAYLVDEVVEIAPGLFLGQLLFATERLFSRYDPALDPSRYGYEHFGYFVIFTEAWNGEARSLFPQLGVPPADGDVGRASSLSVEEASTLSVAAAAAPSSDRFNTLTLADPPDGNVDPQVLADIEQDIADRGGVLQALQVYAKAIDENPAVDASVAARLHTLFNAGICPARMDGFYRGALVGWLSPGLLAPFTLNTVQNAWRIARPFSPWTGKRFDIIDPVRLAEITEGRETGPGPYWYGANTVVSRTALQRFTRGLMEVMQMPLVPAGADERERHGYDAKTFFFVAKPASSIHPENVGKQVIQFNYRWKALRNPPPDLYCIDELVQIADGLYLGQVFYATELLAPWDPARPPSGYRYELFEYFLLMDREWHERRLALGFDLGHV